MTTTDPTKEKCVWSAEQGQFFHYLKSGCGKRGGDVGELNTAGWRFCPFCGESYAFAAREQKSEQPEAGDTNSVSLRDTPTQTPAACPSSNVRSYQLGDPEDDLFSDAMDRAVSMHHSVLHGARRNAAQSGESDTMSGEKIVRRALAAGFKAYLEEIGSSPVETFALPRLEYNQHCGECQRNKITVEVFAKRGAKETLENRGSLPPVEEPVGANRPEEWCMHLTTYEDCPYGCTPENGSAPHTEG